MSHALGVQCSCRYLIGRWKRSPLIPTHRIRTVHLIDRVTNATVTPHLFLELRRSPPATSTSNATIEATPPFTDDLLNTILCLQPLFSVVVGGDEDGDAAHPLCCLPLQSLVTVYRLAHAVLFRESVPCAF